MAKKAPRGIHIACQRIFRNAIVNSSILTILVKQGRQRWCMFLAPWRQWHAQNTQCTGPRVECIASAVTATPRTCSSQEPGARIGMKKSLYSNHRQLFRLEESSLFAVLSESPDPVKVIYDRSTRKVALSPHVDNLALARIIYLYLLIHELLDEITQKKFDPLSRQPHIILAFWWASVATLWIILDSG